MYPNQKGKRKNCLCRWHDLIKRKLYKDSRKKTIRPHKFSKVAGYKSKIQKSFALLGTKNELSEREFKEIIPFIIAPKTIKYLGVNSLSELTT